MQLEPSRQQQPGLRIGAMIGIAAEYRDRLQRVKVSNLQLVGVAEQITQLELPEHRLAATAGKVLTPSRLGHHRYPGADQSRHPHHTLEQARRWVGAARVGAKVHPGVEHEGGLREKLPSRFQRWADFLVILAGDEVWVAGGAGAAGNRLQGNRAQAFEGVSQAGSYLDRSSTRMNGDCQAHIVEER